MFALLLKNKSAKKDFAKLCESPSESRLYDPEIIFKRPPIWSWNYLQKAAYDMYIFADFFSCIQFNSIQFKQFKGYP
jgi:hypothetical protein